MSETIPAGGGVAVARMTVRYTYRLRPGQAARRYLAREWGACRFVWNALVEQSKTRHIANLAALAQGLDPGELGTFGYAAQSKFLTHLRATAANAETGERWLAAGSAGAQQQTVRDFAAARSKALVDRKNKIPMTARRGLPRFKSRHTSKATLNYTRHRFALVPDLDTGVLVLRLPSGVKIPVVWSRELPSDPSSVRVYRDAVGHWYASFVVIIAAEPLPGTGRVAGVDWGVSETATTVSVHTVTGDIDDGPEFDLLHRQHGRTAAEKLARYQRMMARRATSKGKPNTKGYERAKRQTARAHLKVARQRRDDARKWAKKVITAHDAVAVEDFKPRFLARSTMARKAADAAIAATKAELIWQATKAGRSIHLIHPAHTTMDCAGCGARAKHRLPLGERTYTCTACGLIVPRDKNSAAVMVARAGLNPVDVEGVSPEPAAVRGPAA